MKPVYKSNPLHKIDISDVRKPQPNWNVDVVGTTRSMQFQELFVHNTHDFELV